MHFSHRRTMNIQKNNRILYQNWRETETKLLADKSLTIEECKHFLNRTKQGQGKRILCSYLKKFNPTNSSSSLYFPKLNPLLLHSHQNSSSKVLSESRYLKERESSD